MVSLSLSGHTPMTCLCPHPSDSLEPFPLSGHTLTATFTFSHPCDSRPFSLSGHTPLTFTPLGHSTNHTSCWAETAQVKCRWVLGLWQHTLLGLSRSYVVRIGTTQVICFGTARHVLGSDSVSRMLLGLRHHVVCCWDWDSTHHMLLRQHNYVIEIVRHILLRQHVIWYWERDSSHNYAVQTAHVRLGLR